VSVIRAQTLALGRKLVIYAFMVVVGMLAGRIIAAAWMFNRFGWTATWIEIGYWGPRYEPPNPTFVTTSNGSS
jgi:hypothetical protein